MAIELLSSEQKEHLYPSKVVYCGRKYSPILNQVAAFSRVFQLFVRTTETGLFYHAQKTLIVIAATEVQRSALKNTTAVIIHVKGIATLGPARNVLYYALTSVHVVTLCKIDAVLKCSQSVTVSSLGLAQWVTWLLGHVIKEHLEIVARYAMILVRRKRLALGGKRN